MISGLEYPNKTIQLVYFMLFSVHTTFDLSIHAIIQTKMYKGEDDSLNIEHSHGYTLVFISILINQIMAIIYKQTRTLKQKLVLHSVGTIFIV